MIWGILAMMAFNLIDTWFVAQLGPAELAAMSFSVPVVMVLISLGIGLMAYIWFRRACRRIKSLAEMVNTLRRVGNHPFYSRAMRIFKNCCRISTGRDRA